jgi:hypothetical protein
MATSTSKYYIKNNKSARFCLAKKKLYVRMARMVEKRTESNAGILLILVLCVEFLGSLSWGLAGCEP